MEGVAVPSRGGRGRTGRALKVCLAMFCPGGDEASVRGRPGGSRT